METSLRQPNMFLNINSSWGVDLAEPRSSNTHQKMTTGKDEPANMLAVLSKDVIYSSSICLAKHVTTLARPCNRPLVLGSGVNKEHRLPPKKWPAPFWLFCCYFLIWSSFLSNHAQQAPSHQDHPQNGQSLLTYVAWFQRMIVGGATVFTLHFVDVVMSLRIACSLQTPPKKMVMAIPTKSFFQNLTPQKHIFISRIRLPCFLGFEIPG